MAESRAANQAGEKDRSGSQKDVDLICGTSAKKVGPHSTSQWMTPVMVPFPHFSSIFFSVALDLFFFYLNFTCLLWVLPLCSSGVPFPHLPAATVFCNHQTDLSQGSTGNIAVQERPLWKTTGPDTEGQGQTTEVRQ